AGGHAGRHLGHGAARLVLRRCDRPHQAPELRRDDHADLLSAWFRIRLILSGSPRPRVPGRGEKSHTVNRTVDEEGRGPGSFSPSRPPRPRGPGAGQRRAGTMNPIVPRETYGNAPGGPTMHRPCLRRTAPVLLTVVAFAAATL